MNWNPEGPRREDGWVLKPEYLDLYVLWYCSDRGCTCFLSPPCSYCMDDGNIDNLLETDEAWEHPVKAAVRLTLDISYG